MLVSLRKFSGTSLTTRREPWREAAAVCLTAPKWEEGAEAFPSVRVDPAAAPPVRETPSRVCLRDTTCRSFLRFVCFFFSHLLHKSLGNPPLRWTALRGSPRPEGGGGRQGGREGFLRPSGRAVAEEGIPIEGVRALPNSLHGGTKPRRSACTHQSHRAVPAGKPLACLASPSAVRAAIRVTGKAGRHGVADPRWRFEAASRSGYLIGGIPRGRPYAVRWLVRSEWRAKPSGRSGGGSPWGATAQPRARGFLSGTAARLSPWVSEGGGCWFTAAEAAFVVRRRTEWKCRRGREVNVGAREAVGQRAHGRVEPVTWGEIWTAAQSGMQIGCEVETAHSAFACRGLASVFWIHGGAAKLERFAFCLYSLSVIQCSYIPGCDMQLPCEISLHKSDGHWRAEVQMPNSCGIVGAFTVINCTKSSALFSLQLSFGWGSGILGVCSLCLWHSLNWMYIWF